MLTIAAALGFGERLRGWCATGTNVLLSIAFPWECPVCGGDGDGVAPPFCDPCRAELIDAAGDACPRCACSVGPWGVRTEGCGECRGRKLGFDAAIAIGPYQGPIRELCLGMKHEANAWVAPWLGALLVDARPGLRAEAEKSPDAWVVPVPLHWRRRWSRGYNQAQELARGTARALKLRRVDLLRRTKPTTILAGLGRADRARELRRAFRVRKAPGLKGRTIFLVDDILTTGATCSAAARALKRAGAARVVAVVIGRAEWGRKAMTSGGVTTSPEAAPRPRPTTVRIGTRGSPLARWQATWVAERLRALHPGLTVDLVEIKTQGDRDRNTPLAQIGGLGLFTKEIQRALMEGTVDLAVHSLKDLPTLGPAALVLGAIPPREGLADALIAPRHKTLDALPAGATVGTGSLRRRAQLLHLHPGLNVVAVRGNVETRLAQALGGKLDAVVLAEAGLRRLGLEGHVTERLGPPRFLPAVGQGALGIECRADDAATLGLLAPLDDPATRRAVLAERRALAELEGGCMVPLGAWGRDADLMPGLLALDVAVYDPEGVTRLFAHDTGPLDDPEGLGRRVAQQLREQGAEPLLRRGNPASGNADATVKGDGLTL